MRGLRVSVTAGAIALATAVSVLPPGATGSVVAVDHQTRDVGSALASCTEWIGLPTAELQKRIYEPVPGFGAINAQAYFEGNLGWKYAQDLRDGKSPAQIVGTITDTNRQYLIAALDKDGAAYTGFGPLVPDARGHQTSGATDNRFEGVVGGNTLTRTTMVPAMGATLVAPPDVVAELEKLLGRDIPASEADRLRRGDLAERLFVTLAVGFDDPAVGSTEAEGDWRCTRGFHGGRRSSSQSWLRVDDKDGKPTINLMFSSDKTEDAVRELAQMYYGCRLAESEAEIATRCFSDIAIKSPVHIGIAGKKLKMTTFRGTGRTFEYLAEGSGLQRFTFDPRHDEVKVSISVDGDTETHALPSAGWSKHMNGGQPVWRYRDTDKRYGPITEAELAVKKGTLRIEGTRGGFAFDLEPKPTAVDVSMHVGPNTTYCSHFTAQRGTALSFGAAPAPRTCG